MTYIESSASSPVQPGMGSRFLARIKMPILIMIIVGLVITNVLSLIDDAFHSAAYGVVGSVLGVGAIMMAADLLRNSPTMKRRSDVQKATGTIEAEKKAILAAKAGKHAALERSHKVIEAERAAITKVRDEIQEKTARRAAATTSFANKVSVRTVKNVSRNVASMAAEALPYVGIGVMVGITALDIKDACDTLKDMNELKAAFDLPKEDESVVCRMKVPTVQDVLTSIKTTGQTVYKTAAESINQAGGAIMSVEVPSVSWGQIRDLSGAVVGRSSR